jgi:hypothetical protein
LRLLLCYLLNLLLQDPDVVFLLIASLFYAWLDQTMFIQLKRLSYLLNLLSIQFTRLQINFGIWVLLLK